MKKRIKISDKTESELMFLSHRECCMHEDKTKGDQIHHIDKDPSNNDIDNLVFLCFHCHDNASITGGLSRNLKASTIKRFRRHHYEEIEKRRGAITAKLLARENSLDDTIQATILVEFAKIKAEYSSSSLMDRNKILEKFEVYSMLNFPMLCFELLEFLQLVAFETRSGLPEKMLFTMVSLIEQYYPPNDIKSAKYKIDDISFRAIEIASTIIYDTSIHSHNFKSMKHGYNLLQYLAFISRNLKDVNLRKQVDAALQELESHLQRPERNDLGMAQAMLKLYRNEIDANSFREPIFTPQLIERINLEK